MFNFSWFFLRGSALFILLGFLMDVEIGLSILGFILLHIHLGLRTLLNDYIHIKKVKVLTLLLIRVLVIEIIIYILGLLL